MSTPTPPEHPPDPAGSTQSAGDDDLLAGSVREIRQEEPIVRDEQVANNRSTERSSGNFTLTTIAILSAVVTIFFAFAGATALVCFVDLSGHVDGALSIVMLFFAGVEFAAWRRLRLRLPNNSRHGVPELTVIAQLVVVAVLAVAAFALETNAFSVIGLLLAYLALGGTRIYLLLRCAGTSRAAETHQTALAATTSQTVSTSPGANKAVTATHVGQHTGDQDQPVVEVVMSALNYPKQIGYFVAVILSLAICVSVTANVEAMVHDDDWNYVPNAHEIAEAAAKKQEEKTAKEDKARARKAKEHEVEEAKRKRQQETEANPPTKEGPDHKSSTLEPGEEKEEEETTPCSPIKDSEGVSTQTIEAFEAWFEDSPINPHVLGCPNQVHHTHTALGTIYWSEGFIKNDENPRSLIVKAPGYEHFLVLWPAVEPIEVLLKEDIPLGAPREFPRYYAGTGSFYVLYTSTGSYLLEQQTLKSGPDAVPFTVIPPSAATGTLSSYREHKKWLWVLEHQYEDRSETVFELIPPLTDTPSELTHDSTYELIHYSTRSHRAHRGPKPWFYPAKQENLNIEELLKWIPPISAHEQAFEEAVEKSEQP